MDGVYYVTEYVSDKSAATQFAPTTTGKLQIRGLEADEYTATEIATDTAYNLLKSGIKIAITVSDGTACSVCNKATMTAKATVNGKAVNMANGAVPMTVVNTKGFELPQTGSYGTWMFTVGGILVMGGAAFAIFRLCKKKG